MHLAGQLSRQIFTPTHCLGNCNSGRTLAHRQARENVPGERAKAKTTVELHDRARQPLALIERRKGNVASKRVRF